MELRFASCVVLVLAGGLVFGEDCNQNGAEDAVDISGGASADCNRNGIPDDCEMGPGLPFGYYEAGGFWDVEATEIHTLDIDGDGDLDLAVPTDRNLEIIENSSGVLRRSQHLAHPDAHQWTASLADTDLDRDGDLDLVAAYFSYPPTGALFVLRNKGDGEFEAPAFLHAAEEPRFVVASELDGDGAPDLLTSQYLEGLRVLFGGGAEETLLVPDLNSLSSAAAGDHDGDGDDDIHFAGQIGRTTGLFAIENLGSREFGEPVKMADDPGDSIALLDSESDGDLDLASHHGFSLNDGTGAFTEVVAFPGRGEPADVDGDGDFDLFRSHYADVDDNYVEGFNGFSIRLNTGANVFGPPVAFLTGARSPGVAAFLHLDGDGSPDLVLGMGIRYGGSSIAAFLNDGLPYGQGDTDRNGVIDVCEMFHRGDVNSTGTLNVTDPVRLLNYLFMGDDREIPCLDAADANNDGQADISDGVFILKYMLLGGPPPPSPGPVHEACGKDPEGGDLGCTSYTGCGDLDPRS